MTHSNVRPPSSSAEGSPFQGTQNALARKPLPGPTWAWPVLATLVAAGLVYVVTSSPSEHAAPRTAQADTTLNAAPDAVSSAPAAAEASPAAPGTLAAVAPPSQEAAAGAAAATEAPKAAEAPEPSVASASPAAKKKARAAARRSSRKRSAQTP